MTASVPGKPKRDVEPRSGRGTFPRRARLLRHADFERVYKLGGAVQRNRMKRRLREAVRFTRPPLGANADVVINPKKSLLTADFSAVVNEVSRAFAVIEEKLAGKAAREKA